MTAVFPMLSDAWLEKTGSQPLNVAIGAAKFGAGYLVALRMIQAFPKLGSVGMVALSLAGSVDLFIGINNNRPFHVVDDSDLKTRLGQMGMRPFIRAIQCTTFAALLKTIRVPHTSLGWKAASLSGNVAGALAVGCLPFFELTEVGQSKKLTGLQKIGFWLGVWHMPLST